jgi:hypothetical protein
LWVQIHGQYPVTKALQHVSQVVRERGLADPPLVVEERHRDHVALLSVTDHEVASTRNWAGALPFASREDSMSAIPRPT